MKVFLKKDVEKVGLAGEVVKVGDGYARNYLIPRGMGVEVTAKNEDFYTKQIKQVSNRKEVIASKTSMLAENINSMKLTLKRKMHDDGKLYGSVGANEIVELLAEQGVNVGKSQIILEKTIKAKGSYKVTVKLTASLQPQVTLLVTPESSAHK
jgi:large subunit ribosomal protein L9